MKQKTVPGHKIICLNRKASFNYFFIETLEAGISLKGSEVKSLRDGKGSIADAYAIDNNGELFLINSHIPLYRQSSYNNHNPKGDRKLLLNNAFGFVPQTPSMFSGTVRDNLIYAQPSATDEQVNRALALANAKAFVDALPQGLQTMLGEDGVGLSGGQRQRLAIARALIAEPAFLLLDEATSALDAESEQSIRRSVEALKGEMTILVIAHRLSTVRQADRILVFEEGELIASGTHAELVKDSELYARFADIQFSS